MCFVDSLCYSVKLNWMAGSYISHIARKEAQNVQLQIRDQRHIIWLAAATWRNKQWWLQLWFYLYFPYCLFVSNSQVWLWRPPPKWPILCWVGC